MIKVRDNFALMVAIIIIFSYYLFSQTKIIDNFNNLNTWQKLTSDGAKISISLVDGIKGKAIKIDYKFTGAGYCGLIKKFPMSLPSNYKFNFYVKGNSPKNNLEFKLDDATGDNVWWYVFKRFDFPKDWTEKTIRKRQIAFAWGPQGGGQINNFDKIEIMISAADGGSGTIYLDELYFTKLPAPITSSVLPSVNATSTLKGSPSFIFDNNLSTSWRSKPDDNQSLIINFQYLREYGGLIINWDSLDYATDYNIEASNDLKKWDVLYLAKNNLKNINFIPFGDNESKFLRINLLKSYRQNGYSIKGIKVEDYKFSEDYNYRFEQIASSYPKGYFPRYFSGKQTYWNVIGVNGDSKKGLINEEGMVETDKESFSVEPFLFYNNKFVTWNNVTLKQSLENNYLPISNVTWTNKDLNLEIKAFADGRRDSSLMFIRYLITNNSNGILSGNLYLAVRPFQVNPPWQNLNTTGGVTKINSIDYENSKTVVNNDKEIFSLTHPAHFGAIDSKEGSIIDYISKNILPKNSNIRDNENLASGAFQYPFRINPGNTFGVILIIPFYKNNRLPAPDEDFYTANLFYNYQLKQITKQWENKLNSVEINLPPSDAKLINTLKSNLAYILINRNKDAIQPGSRCYDRAWIRDGAMMSESLLKMGITKEVRDFIDWYSEYQFPSGKIPCAVDRRGADPVPENDSQGEYIYMIKEYFNFTKDTSMLVKHWNNIKGVVNYIKYQISEELTDQNHYGTDKQKSFYGLVPASISHEGYSAKAMHSYWDDFFVLKGLKDASAIAEILDKKNETREYAKLRDEFRKNLYNSIRLAMKNKKIDYIPGCAELGDFDATSTTIAVSSCNELKYLPEPALKNTFDKYYDNFIKRLNPNDDWINYTPYEIRVAETFIYLNEINRAYKLLNYFLKDQRPKGWNNWAEVVWKDSDAPKFIGDIPHTWVGSAYINAVRALFVYEERNDSSLVIGAGIKSEWLNFPKGISADNLPTYYGTLSYYIKKTGKEVRVGIKVNLDLACKRIKLKSPLKQKISSILIDGKESHSFIDKNIYLKPKSQSIVINYEIL